MSSKCAIITRVCTIISRVLNFLSVDALIIFIGMWFTSKITYVSWWWVLGNFRDNSTLKSESTRNTSLDNVLLNPYYINDDTRSEAENFYGISISSQTLKIAWREICIYGNSLLPLTRDYASCSLLQHFRDIFEDDIRGGKKNFYAQSNAISSSKHSPVI